MRRLDTLLLAIGLMGCATSDPTDATAAPREEATADGAAAVCEDALPEVVARVNGKDVTRSELESAAAGELVEARVALYEARRAALENLILERLVKSKAEAAGQSEEEWIRAQVEGKLTPPTEEEIQQFYQENQARMGGASLDQIRPRLVQFLEQQKAGEATREIIEQLEKEAGVETFLTRPRFEVAAEDSPRLGKESAPIEIVEFSDFQCPYCSTAAETVKKVKEKYGDKVSVVYRHFPLPMHREAGKAAQAAECAHEQDKFWAFHDALFAEQKPWTDADLTSYATDIGLDVGKFSSCLESGRHAATVEDDMADGEAVGMSGTPGFYINGVMLTGAQPIEAFEEIIDEELARKGS